MNTSPRRRRREGRDRLVAVAVVDGDRGIAAKGAAELRRLLLVKVAGDQTVVSRRNAATIAGEPG